MPRLQAVRRIVLALGDWGGDEELASWRERLKAVDWSQRAARGAKRD